MAAPNGEAPRSQPALGAVLAGGRGSRIGGAKATAELAGRPLISYSLAAIEEAGLEPLVVAKPGSGLPPLDCRLILEPEQPVHPLCGLIAALREAGERPVIAIGCDMPFAGPLLAALAASRGPLVVASVGGRLEPLPGRFEPTLLPALEAALSAERALRPTLEALRPRTIAGAELTRHRDPSRIFFNVNTPTDLRRAKRMLKQRIRGGT